MNMSELKNGDRIVIDEMPDDPNPVPAGTHGTVIIAESYYWSREPNVVVHWDCDRTLSLVKEDVWHPLPLCPVCDDYVEDETEEYGCEHCDRDNIHEDCGRWFVVEKATWNDPGWSEWACNTCIGDDRAAAEDAELRNAENRAWERASDREHADDMRY